jgi:monoamine oxidase
VKEIDDQGNKVIVKTEREVYECEKVIVTAPPLVIDKTIKFIRGLPKLREEYQKSQFMGDVTKIFAVYKEPWWRKQGYTGIILNTEKDELFQASFDNSPVDAKQGILFAFCIGDKSKIF